MRAGVFSKNLMQCIASQAMRKSIISFGKAERETACTPAACSGLVCKTRL